MLWPDRRAGTSRHEDNDKQPPCSAEKDEPPKRRTAPMSQYVILPQSKLLPLYWPYPCVSRRGGGMRFVLFALQASYRLFFLVSSRSNQDFPSSLHVVNSTHEKTVRWRLDAMKKLHPWTGHHRVPPRNRNHPHVRAPPLRVKASVTNVGYTLQWLRHRDVFAFNYSSPSSV